MTLLVMMHCMGTTGMMNCMPLMVMMFFMGARGMTRSILAVGMVSRVGTINFMAARELTFFVGTVVLTALTGFCSRQTSFMARMAMMI